MEAKLIKTQKGYHLDTGEFDGIHLACYPHDVTKQRLSLKNCEEIFWGLYDTEMDVEVEMEKKEQAGENVWMEPLLDADGCLILKRL